MDIKQLPQAFEIEKDGMKLIVAQRKAGTYTLAMNYKGKQWVRLKNRQRNELASVDGELSKIIELLREAQMLFVYRQDF